MFLVTFFVSVVNVWNKLDTKFYQFLCEVYQFVRKTKEIEEIGITIRGDI